MSARLSITGCDIVFCLSSPGLFAFFRKISCQKGSWFSGHWFVVWSWPLQHLHECGGELNSPEERVQWYQSVFLAAFTHLR